MGNAIEVVAALIWQGGRFMICRRPEHKARGGLWEFVGGKVEVGETKEEALVRECREELDVTLSVGRLFYEVTHVYPDLTVHLSLFEAEMSGQPRLLEHTDLRFILPREIPLYKFCPADETILTEIVRNNHTPLQEKLAALADPVYRDFQAKLIPTVPPSRVLGVRLPVLRAFAKDFGKTPEAEQFLAELPHYYYDENNLHAFLLEKEKDPDALVKKLDAFLPFVDNWATCDTLIPKLFEKRREELYPQVVRWIRSDDPYARRFAMGTLMRFYLSDGFSPEHPKLILAADDGSYYLSMMAAWYFATALFKQEDAILPYFTDHSMRPETKKRAIRKALESYRIRDDIKTLLKVERIYEQLS